jgi:hypothetical protein
MTSELAEPAQREARNGPVRLKSLAKYFTFSTMLAVMFASGAGGVGCAEETFKCCECAFDCQAPDPADPTGATLVPATYYLCDCPSGDSYTYEQCGTFCKLELTQAELDARALTNVPPMSMCTLVPKQASVLAKNSCSPGWPVGEP